MKIIDAINRINDKKPNVYSQEDKIKWLSIVDALVKREIIDTHEGGENVTFEGYTTSTPLDTELLIGEPYDDMYIFWLESKIDYNNADYDLYNNSITRFSEMYSALSRNYNTTHMPLGERVKYF